jgi:hypothetical protein
LKATALHLNPLVANLGEKDRSAGEKVAQALGPFGFKYTEGKHPSVNLFYAAYRNELDRYARQSTDAKKSLGLKEKRPPELTMLEGFGEKIRQLDRAYYEPGTTPRQKEKIRQDQAAVAQAALQKLEAYRRARQPQ